MKQASKLTIFGDGGSRGNPGQAAYGFAVFDKDNNYSIKFLSPSKDGKAQVIIKNFGSTYNSLVIIPSLEAKFSGFDTLDLSYPYSFTVSVSSNAIGDDPAAIQKLLAQIDSLKEQIAKAKAGKVPATPADTLCFAISSNLYLGLSHNSEVRCLQTFLTSRGPNIYPEGLVTGNFGNLTKLAVIRFQKRYGILQTGFVGVVTREKINQLLMVK